MKKNEINMAFAPMEGIVTAAYRRVFKKYFGGVDRFYTPFLAANQNHKFRRREKCEYLPYDPDLVPQVITSSADDFLWAVGTIAEAGYHEVNLNLSCPSSTVVTKHKGAGMLLDKPRFDEFFSRYMTLAMPCLLYRSRHALEPGLMTRSTN